MEGALTNVHVLLFACFSRKDNRHQWTQHMSINKTGRKECIIDKGVGSVGVHQSYKK